MSPVRNALVAGLLALGLVAAASPVLADQGTGVSTPLGCVNVLVSQMSDGLAVYAAMGDVIGFGVSSATPGDGAEFAVLFVPSKCGVVGAPAIGANSAELPSMDSPVLLPLP